MRRIILILTMWVVASSGYRSVEGQDAIDQESLRRMTEDIQKIASDGMEGRGPGTQGIDKAAEFIHQRWKQLGLKTDLIDGGPFQPFEIDGPLAANDVSSNRLTLVGPDGAASELKLSDSISTLAIGANGAFEGELVFVGYGISAKTDKIDYDDYADMDVKGKVVVLLRKEPQQSDESSVFAGKDPSDYSFFTSKQITAFTKGAAAVLIVNDRVTAESGDTLIPSEGAGRGFGRKRVPTIFVKREMIDKIVTAIHGKSLKEIEEAIDQDLKPRSFALTGWKASGEVKIEEGKQKVKNILALLPGEGALAKETVIVGAHYDHVGMGGVGSLAPGTFAIHNGADDNGSGTVALMEVAKRMVDRLGTPRRQILFISFSAEERGLLGSIHYCRNPRFDLEDTVAMVNMDMVGRLKNDELEISGTGTAENFDELVERLNAIYRFKLTKKPEGVGPSDHASFFEEKIPVFHFFTGLHNDYHRPSDDWDKINVAGMVRIVDMMCDAIEEIATAESRPVFVPVAGPRNPFSSPAPKGRLYVELNESMEIEKIEAGKAAAVAGLQVGDKILELEGTVITAPSTLSTMLERYRPGRKVKIQYERMGEKKVVEVKLEQ